MDEVPNWLGICIHLNVRIHISQLTRPDKSFASSIQTMCQQILLTGRAGAGCAFVLLFVFQGPAQGSRLSWAPVRPCPSRWGLGQQGRPGLPVLQLPPALPALPRQHRVERAMAIWLGPPAGCPPPSLPEISFL